MTLSQTHPGVTLPNQLSETTGDFGPSPALRHCLDLCRLFRLFVLGYFGNSGETLALLTALRRQSSKQSRSMAWGESVS